MRLVEKGFCTCNLTKTVSCDNGFDTALRADMQWMSVRPPPPPPGPQPPLRGKAATKNILGIQTPPKSSQIMEMSVESAQDRSSVLQRALADNKAGAR